MHILYESLKISVANTCIIPHFWVPSLKHREVIKRDGWCRDEELKSPIEQDGHLSSYEKVNRLR